MLFLFFIFKFNWYTICIEHYILREHLNVTCWDQSITINVWVNCCGRPPTASSPFLFYDLLTHNTCVKLEDLSSFSHHCDNMTSTKMRHSFHAKFHIQVIPYEMHFQSISNCISAVLSMWRCKNCFSHPSFSYLLFLFNLTHKTPNMRETTNYNKPHGPIVMIEHRV